MKKRIYLIDIDGTVCDDIKNEDNHLYEEAKPYEGSREQINVLYDEGNKIVFFTAREYKDKPVRGITYKGEWAPIVEIQNHSKEIKTLLKFKNGTNI